MEPARTIPLIAGLVIISVIVAALLMRTIWREISGLSDENDGAQAGRTGGGTSNVEKEEKSAAERLNDRKMLKEIERWRDGK